MKGGELTKMKTYTIIELMELALESDSLEVLRFVSGLADQTIKEQKEELQALEEAANDRGSMMDQFPEDFMEGQTI